MTNDFEFLEEKKHPWMNPVFVTCCMMLLGCIPWHDGVIQHFRSSNCPDLIDFFSFLFEYSRKYYLIIPSCNQNFPVFWLKRYMISARHHQTAGTAIIPSFYKLIFNPKFVYTKLKGFFTLIKDPPDDDPSALMCSAAFNPFLSFLGILFKCLNKFYDRSSRLPWW